jgi:hypothetical protein
MNKIIPNFILIKNKIKVIFGFLLFGFTYYERNVNLKYGNFSLNEFRSFMTKKTRFFLGSFIIESISYKRRFLQLWR